MEDKGKAKGIKGIVNIEDRGTFSRSRMDKLFISEMVFSVLVSQFKLRGFNFSEEFFSEVKFSLVR